MNLVAGLHLDLKGVQFRPEYAPQLLRDVASQGINTLLVEYEDVFPFAHLDIAFDKAAVWPHEQLQSFLSHAQQHGLEVIPLQQCLGHLEYLLGRAEYRHLALDKSYPSTLDITNSEAKQLIFSMLRKVLQSHPHSQFIHLGMDEAHALIQHARRTGQDVVALFFGFLDELCAICEEFGKTPLIWSDMLEDYISTQSLPLFETFRARVILCPWDYVSTGDVITKARIGGWRISREWLTEPDNLAAPPIAADQLFIEDLPAEILALVAPYRRGRGFIPMFQADLWTSLGFRVIGASAVRISGDGPILPLFNDRRENIRAWWRAVERTNALGQIATSWARGTTWCPPNFPCELCWPLLDEVAASSGSAPASCFGGIDGATQERIFRTIGRCRDEKNGWRLEAQVLEEMKALAPQLSSHQYEWHCLMLMLRVLLLHRRCAFAGLEAWDFACSKRLIDIEWQRRLDEQATLQEELHLLRQEVEYHFGVRWFGESFEEWLQYLFETPAMQLRNCSAVCEAKLGALQAP